MRRCGSFIGRQTTERQYVRQAIIILYPTVCARILDIASERRQQSYFQLFLPFSRPGIWSNVCCIIVLIHICEVHEGFVFVAFTAAGPVCVDK